jgi:hypothetical protein
VLAAVATAAYTRVLPSAYQRETPFSVLLATMANGTSLDTQLLRFAVLPHGLLGGTTARGGATALGGSAGLSGATALGGSAGWVDATATTALGECLTNSYHRLLTKRLPVVALPYEHVQCGWNARVLLPACRCNGSAMLTDAPWVRSALQAAHRASDAQAHWRRRAPGHRRPPAHL